MESFREFYTEMLKKDVSVGDVVKNINPECEHYDSEGVVVKIIKRSEIDSDEVSNKHNIPGSDVKYCVTNDTENATKGDMLTKSLDQLKILKSMGLMLN